MSHHRERGRGHRVSEQQKMRPNGLFRMPVKLAGEQKRMNPFPWFEQMRANEPALG